MHQATGIGGLLKSGGKAGLGASARREAVCIFGSMRDEVQAQMNATSWDLSATQPNWAQAKD